MSYNGSFGRDYKHYSRTLCEELKHVLKPTYASLNLLSGEEFEPSGFQLGLSVVLNMHFMVVLNIGASPAKFSLEYFCLLHFVIVFSTEC